MDGKEWAGQMLAVVGDIPIVLSRGLTLTVTTHSVGLSSSQMYLERTNKLPFGRC